MVIQWIRIFNPIYIQWLQLSNFPFRSSVLNIFTQALISRRSHVVQACMAGISASICPFYAHFMPACLSIPKWSNWTATCVNHVDYIRTESSESHLSVPNLPITIERCGNKTECHQPFYPRFSEGKIGAKAPEGCASPLLMGKPLVSLVAQLEFVHLNHLWLQRFTSRKDMDIFLIQKQLPPSSTQFYHGRCIGRVHRHAKKLCSLMVHNRTWFGVTKLTKSSLLVTNDNNG